jgi:hypothetical protein
MENIIPEVPGRDQALRPREWIFQTNTPNHYNRGLRSISIYPSENNGIFQVHEIFAGTSSLSTTQRQFELSQDEVLKLLIEFHNS